MCPLDGAARSPLGTSPGKVVFYESRSWKLHSNRCGGVPPGAATFIVFGLWGASAQFLKSPQYMRYPLKTAMSLFHCTWLKKISNDFLHHENRHAFCPRYESVFNIIIVRLKRGTQELFFLLYPVSVNPSYKIIHRHANRKRISTFALTDRGKYLSHALDGCTYHRVKVLDDENVFI